MHTLKYKIQRKIIDKVNDWVNMPENKPTALGYINGKDDRIYNIKNEVWEKVSI